MMYSWRKALATGALCAFASATAVAQSNSGSGQDQAGDPLAGRDAFYTCIGCHGIEDYNNAYPTYHVPKVAGQHAAYIEAALKAYRSGDREHPTMHAQASSLSDKQIRDIAAYLSQRTEQ